MHSLQTLIVALLVPGCALYAAWKLMPSGARRSLAASLLRMPHLPTPLAARLQRHAQAATGCGCDGCDHADKRPAAAGRAEHAIVFQRRPRP